MRLQQHAREHAEEVSTVSETNLPRYKGYAEANLGAAHHIGRSRSVQSPFQNAPTRAEEEAGWAGVRRAAARCHLQL